MKERLLRIVSLLLLFLVWKAYNLDDFLAKKRYLEAHRQFGIIGVYMSDFVLNNDRYYNIFLNHYNKFNKINRLVIDLTEETSDEKYHKVLKFCERNNIYPIARLVVFTEGEGATWQDAKDLTAQNKKIELAQRGAELGFLEIQFDYIRFKDEGEIDYRKNEIVNNFLKRAKDKLRYSFVKISADIFGSVTELENTRVGQKLEDIASLTDIYYPMVYPSHYLYLPLTSKPYLTVYRAITIGKERTKYHKAKLIPYIQAFALNIEDAKLDMKGYIKEQLRAVRDADCEGFIAWNMYCDYRPLYAALDEPLPPTKKLPDIRSNYPL